MACFCTRGDFFATRDAALHDGRYRLWDVASGERCGVSPPVYRLCGTSLCAIHRR